MFNDLKEELKKVYLLAKERHLEESTCVDDFTVENLRDTYAKDLSYSAKENELFDVLNGLDFESIKIIQTIMYIGRDHDYDRNDSYETRYKKYRESLDFRGWNEKEIEVDQIVQKVPLDNYLKDGFEILGINL